MKKIFFALITAAVVLSVTFFFLASERNAAQAVDSFAACKENGYEIREKFPAECVTPDGRVFVEEVSETDSNTPNDLGMVVVYPEAGSRVGSPVEVRGNARGTWFFEGSFPAKIISPDGQELGFGIMTAETDWMTEDYVAFKGSLGYTNPQKLDGGKLVLSADNPSGMPEHDKSFEVMIKFTVASTTDEVITPEPEETGGTTTGGTATGTTQTMCRRTGCSSQICSDHDVVSTCEYAEFYACYDAAVCEMQPDNSCGWTMTATLQQCIAEKTMQSPMQPL